MNTLREFRKKAKLGQEAMAELLHTTRSLLSMAELGQRVLPEESMERLKMFQAAKVQLIDLPISADPAFTIGEEEVQRETRLAWKALLVRNRYNMHSNTKRLNALKTKHQKHLDMYELYFKAITTLTASGSNQAELDYFSSELKKIQIKVLSCGKIPQLRLQVSIDLLREEEKLLIQHLGSD